MARIPSRGSIYACVACLAPQSRSLNCAATSLPADLPDSSPFDENGYSVEVEGEQSQALTCVTVALNVILVELMPQPRQPFAHFLRVRAAGGPVNFQLWHGLRPPVCRQCGPSAFLSRHDVESELHFVFYLQATAHGRDGLDAVIRLSQRKLAEGAQHVACNYESCGNPSRSRYAV